MTEEQNTRDGTIDGDSLEQALASYQDEIAEHLRDGGPPVDLLAINRYIDGELDDETATEVRRKTITWREWNETYRQERMAATEAEFAEEKYRENGPQQTAPPKEEVRIAEEHLVGDTQSAERSKVIDSVAIRAEIDHLLGPYKAGERAMSECNLVAIVKSVALMLLGDVGSPAARRQFYEVATEYIDQVLTENARRLAGDLEGRLPVSPSPDTVSSDTFETTFVATAAEARRALTRRDELAKLKEALPEAVQCYSLGRFVSDEEMASWFDVDTADVVKQRKFVGAKLALADSRP